jgi:DNA-directed RNA polymerase subunit RPC12/RpoP
VRELFQGQRNYDRGNVVDIEMSLDDAGRCSFCETSVDTTRMAEEEYLCLACGRTVCGKCGVRQYLSEGDYVACLDCVHQG